MFVAYLYITYIADLSTNTPKYKYKGQTSCIHTFIGFGILSHQKLQELNSQSQVTKKHFPVGSCSNYCYRLK